jgi:type II secretion system protein C
MAAVEPSEYRPAVGKQLPPTRVGRVAYALSRWLSIRTLSVVVALAVGVYAAVTLLPTFTGKVFVRKDAASVSGTQMPAVASTDSSPLAQTSVLGTASSLSNERLQLFLVATQPGRNAREGTASLGTDPRNAQTYMAGAVLVNGARLLEIQADRVVLEAQGQQTTLMMDRAQAASSAGPKVVATPLTSAGQVRVALTTVRAPDEQLRPRPRATSNASVRDINEVLRGQPVFRDTELVGFSVLPGQQSGRFAQLGLQSGDVITAVEGAPVTKASHWSAVSDALLAGATVNVSVERAGQLTVLSLDGAALQKNTPPAMPPPGAMPGPALP